MGGRKKPKRVEHLKNFSSQRLRYDKFVLLQLERNLLLSNQIHLNTWKGTKLLIGRQPCKLTSSGMPEFRRKVWIWCTPKCILVKYYQRIRLRRSGEGLFRWWCWLSTSSRWKSVRASLRHVFTYIDGTGTKNYYIEKKTGLLDLGLYTLLFWYIIWWA